MMIEPSRSRNVANRVMVGLVVICLVLFSLITYAIYFTSLPDIDARIARAMMEHAQQHRVVRGMFLMITELGSVALLTALAAVGILWSCALGRFRLAAFWLFVTFGGALFNVGVKELIDRKRPPREMRDKGIPELNESYPSGHAMGSAIGFAMVGLAIYGALRTRLRRIVVFSGFVVVVLLIGFSRVYLRAHWFSDVIAGIALGTAWVAGWYWLLKSRLHVNAR